MDQTQIPWLAAVAIIGAIAMVQTLRLTHLRHEPGRRAKVRTERAMEGEVEAESLLRGAGFRIAERQPRATVCVWVDGEPIEVEVRGDLLVHRRGRRYLAEVKTGTTAPRITHGPTRRQLLEYRHAFDIDGLLLVDADRETVREIAFEEPRRGILAWLLRAS